MHKKRLQSAVRAFGLHLIFSVVAVLVAAIVVFFIWYPHPYASLMGGTTLFVLIVGVDVVCGPLLTLILFTPRKSKKELALDLSIVALLQIAALAYGLYTMAIGRPIYLAYELDRFRVISYVDLAPGALSQKPARIEAPGWLGPKKIGIRVAQPDDPDYLAQVELSINGLEPVHRPDRWTTLEHVEQQILEKSKPMEVLIEKYPTEKILIESAVKKISESITNVNWVPIQSRRSTSWVALIDKRNAAILGFLPLDGF